MDQIVRTLASFGLYGKPLNELSETQISVIRGSEYAEVVLKEQVESLKEKFHFETLSGNQIANVSKLKPADKYVVRLSSTGWRRIIMKGLNISGFGYYQIMSEILMKGCLSRSELRKLVSDPNHSFSKWLKKLQSCNILRATNKDNEEFYSYIEPGDENITAEQPFINSEPLLKQQSLSQNTTPKRQANKISNISASQPSKRQKSTPKKQVFDPETFLANNMEMIKSYDNGILLETLKNETHLNDEQIENLTDYVSEGKESMLEIVELNDGKAIIYIQEICAKNIDSETLQKLVECGREWKIFLLSEKRSDLKKIAPTLFQKNDEVALEIFEENGFGAVEIRSKYISPEFVIFISEIEKDDENLHQYLQKTKAKVHRYFKDKVKNIFYKNTYLNSLDNGYIPELKSRIKVFYEFIMSQLTADKKFFILDTKALLEFKMLPFLSCIPIKTEHFLIEIVIDISCNTNSELSSDLSKIDLETLDCESYPLIIKKCQDFLGEMKIKDVISNLSHGSVLREILYSKISVAEFDKLLTALTSYNIFESYSDESYFYFEVIEGIEDYVNLLFRDISENADSTFLYAPYADRKRFYDQIIEFSQEEFYHKSMLLLKEGYSANTIEYFTKKLQAINKMALNYSSF
jgi:HTH-like